MASIVKVGDLVKALMKFDPELPVVVYEWHPGDFMRITVETEVEECIDVEPPYVLVTSL